MSRGVGHRIAFVMLSAVQTVPADAGAGRLDPPGPAGARPAGHRVVRAAASGRSSRSSARCSSGRSSMSASGRFALEARGFGARPGRTAYRVVAGSAVRPGRCGSRWSLACVGVVVGAVDGGLAVTDGAPTGAAEAPLRRSRTSSPLPGPRGAEPAEVTARGRRPGERVGVAGRTGAGKSTLALAAAGFIPRVVARDRRRVGDDRRRRRAHGRRGASSSAGSGSSSRHRPTSCPPRS